MANWKTSVVGLVILLLGAGLLSFGKITWDQFIAYVGIFSLSLLTKDYDMHGGTKAQGTPPSVQAETLKEGIAIDVAACKKDPENCK